MRLLLLIITVFVSTYSTVEGQTVNQFNSWWAYFGDHKLSNKIGLYTEFQLRRHDFIKDSQQAMARAGLNYFLS